MQFCVAKANVEIAHLALDPVQIIVLPVINWTPE